MVVAIYYIEGEINPANDYRSRYIHLLSTAYVVFPITVTYHDYHWLFTLDRINNVREEVEEKTTFLILFSRNWKGICFIYIWDARGIEKIKSVSKNKVNKIKPEQCIIIIIYIKMFVFRRY